MAIQFIGNQPLTWNTQLDTASDCKTDNSILCTYYVQGDTLFAQWKQTPCDDTNRVCNPTFENTNSDLITNGKFNTNTNGWVLGGGAVYDSVNDRVDLNGGSLTQSGLSIASGVSYILTFNYGGSGLINPLVVQLGGVTVATLFGSGNVEINVSAGGANTSIIFGGGYTGYVDNIVLRVNSADDWTVWYPVAQPSNGDFQYIAESLTHVPGSGNLIVQNPTCQIRGAYYKLKIKVTGMTAGTLWIDDQGATFGQTTYADPTSYLKAITKDGIYEIYSSTSNFIAWSFYFSPDCDATISQPEIIEYSNYINAILISSGGTQFNLNSSVTYEEDWITLKKDLTGINNGCYTLRVTDACGYQLNETVTCDVNFNQALNTGWQYVAEYGDIASTTISGGKFTITASTPTGVPYIAWRLRDLNPCFYNYPSPVLNVSFQYTLTTLQVDEPFKVQLIIPGASTTPFIIFQAVGNQTYTGTVNLSFPNGFTGTTYDLRFNTSGAGGNGISNGEKIEIDYFKLEIMAYYPGQVNTYDSNCIELSSADACMMWVGGTNGEDAFGFHFNPADAVPFQVGSRVKAMLINPKYSGELKRYEDAEGNIIVTKGKTGKVYTLFIDYTDETHHDWLRVATLSDTIDINGKYYVGTEGDYEPEWPDNLGNWNYAQARVEVQKKVDVLYNNNAG